MQFVLIVARSIVVLNHNYLRVSVRWSCRVIVTNECSYLAAKVGTNEPHAVRLSNMSTLHLPTTRRKPDEVFLLPRGGTSSVPTSYL